MPATRAPHDTRIVVVGAGFGGIAVAIELRRHGFTDVTILERSAGIGGTWRHNTYPGAACDVPSHLYSFSFATRRDWTRLCSPQPEILAYLTDVAHEHGVDRLVVPGTEVASCAWDDARRRWTVTSADDRRWEADVLIVATGQLHRPAYPRIEGRDEFAGRAFHSAEWDHDYDLTGRRVAVVGTGASAVQLVPEVAERAASLVVFQRTGNWFLPRRNRPYPRLVRQAIMRVPGLQALRRRLLLSAIELLTAFIRHPRTLGRLGRLWSAAFMRSQLRDPGVRRKAWPDYTFGCKRILFSSSFLPTLQRPNVELVTEPIARLTRDGVLTAAGVEHAVDCVIYGTGFRTTEFVFPMRITGRDGSSLDDAWAHGAHAHLGMAVPGFASLFVMYGPNTNTSGGSVIVYLEAQAGYIRQALQAASARGGAAVEVRADVEAASDREVQARFAGTAWMDCASWYRDASGRIVTNWPGYMREYVARTRVFEPAEFVFHAPVVASGADEPAAVA